MSDEAKWYVVHTYSGYENKVKANIEKVVENRDLQEQILEVVVPMQDGIEIKNGQKKSVQRKILPGYVLLKMFMNDDTWYIVRNTRGVTSFVGPGSKPVPLTDNEVRSMGIEAKETVVDISIGDAVKVCTGLFENSIGIVKEVNTNKHTAVVIISFFGRDTRAELDFTQIERI